MRAKKIWLILVVVILIVGFGIFLIKDSKATGNTGGNSNSNNVQKVTLSFKDGNYYPQTVTVKVNETVRIYLDSSVGGCYRTFTINDLGVIKNIETPADYAEFTPTKRGTYKFACIMNMGTGTLIVE